MIELRDTQTGRLFGSITEEQLQFMINELEEEFEGDTDYYINRATLDMFEQDGGDGELLKLLREGLGEREEMEIKWLRK